MSQDNSRDWLWTATTTGQFSYASAWHIVRNPSPIFIRLYGFLDRVQKWPVVC